MNSQIKKQHYFVKGMHCASCEILIEKKLLELEGIKSVRASINDSKVLIEYIGEKPSIKELNRIFEKENYIFSDEREIIKTNLEIKDFVIALLIIIGIAGLNKLGVTGLINVNSTSSLPTFFFLGFLAGISTCAALVGGIILSLSKQWLEMYSDRKSTIRKLQPHLLFNTGRLVSYVSFGALLGAIGNKIQPSLTLTSILVIFVSVLMFISGLQMLGIKIFSKFKLALPKSITGRISNESNFKGRYFPFLMGALTFFLPCGFTITAQGFALLSGNPLQGSLIMFFFSLGTLIPLLFIGLSSIKFYENKHLAPTFLKIAGFLVIFFAIYNINAKLNVLDFNNFGKIDLKENSTINNDAEKGFVPIIEGKQILKMEASSSGYKPNYFKVKVGIPVHWEITDKGTNGCTNAVISRSLFDGEIPLTPGEISIKEFTPTKVGKYKFSCWMGMISGIIEVI